MYLICRCPSALVSAQHQQTKTKETQSKRVLKKFKVCLTCWCPRAWPAHDTNKGKKNITIKKRLRKVSRCTLFVGDPSAGQRTTPTKAKRREEAKVWFSETGTPYSYLKLFTGSPAATLIAWYDIVMIEIARQIIAATITVTIPTSMW